MAEFLIALTVGTVLGVLAGLGTGGGSLLLIWLTSVMGTDPMQARSVNLLFFLPGALIVSLLRHKQGNLPIKKLLPAIVFGCAAAAAASLISRTMELTVLKKMFGALLIASGIRELCYRKR